ncbi:hypothetical protein JCM8097_003530 [Rhodosporidiobolus ruineniae]
MTRLLARSTPYYSSWRPLRPPAPAPRAILALSSSSLRFTSTSATSPSHPREDPRWPGWTPTIGLELHVQLRGNPKLFSPAKAVYDAEPNKHVARFDAALPGSLPVLQSQPVHLALLAALALDCDINRSSTFDRKHYFYPDLPAGFQITQKYSPLAKDGTVRVRLDTGKGGSKKKAKKGGAAMPEYIDVRIEQVQLEQDTAKSFHDPSLLPPPSPSPPDAAGEAEEEGGTLVDLTRAGCALVEIVTRPDMSTPEEAGAFVRTLQSILRHVGASRADMEKGELRCDVNVSVARTGSAEQGTRCEVKNLNGVRFVQGAIEAEILRQIASLSSSPPVPIAQATRGYNPLTHTTFHLRGKESAVDYRYMPDPELGAVRVTEGMLEGLRRGMPELPDVAYVRLQEEYGLSARDAGILVALGEGGAAGEGEGGELGEEADAAIGVRWFEEVVKADGEGWGSKERIKGAVNWLIHELLGQLSKASLSLASCPVKPAELAEVVDAVKGGRITGTNAKQLLRDYLALRAPSSPYPSPTISASSATPTSLSSSTTPAPSFSAFLAPHLSAAPSSSSSSSSSSATDDLSPLVSAVIAALPAEASKVRAGQTKVLMRMVGEAMKRSKGKADAKKVGEELRRKLGVPEE